MNERFEKLAALCSSFVGRPLMFLLCLLLSINGIVAFFSKDDHFLNGANIAISIVTLLMLPILQASQNRDGAALQAKLDELIRSHSEARDTMIGVEQKGAKEIERRRPNAAD